MQVYDTQQKIVDILQRPMCGSWEALGAVGGLVLICLKFVKFCKAFDISI